MLQSTKMRLKWHFLSNIPQGDRRAASSKEHSFSSGVVDNDPDTLHLAPGAFRSLLLPPYTLFYTWEYRQETHSKYTAGVFQTVPLLLEFSAGCDSVVFLPVSCRTGCRPTSAAPCTRTRRWFHGPLHRWRWASGQLACPDAHQDGRRHRCSVLTGKRSLLTLWDCQ